MEEKQIDSLVKWIQEKTAKIAYRFTVNTERKPGSTDTKFGGVPYWDKEMEYPRRRLGSA